MWWYGWKAHDAFRTGKRFRNISRYFLRGDWMQSSCLQESWCNNYQTNDSAAADDLPYQLCTPSLNLFRSPVSQYFVNIISQRSLFDPHVMWCVMFQVYNMLGPAGGRSVRRTLSPLLEMLSRIQIRPFNRLSDEDVVSSNRSLSLSILDCQSIHRVNIC